MEGQMRIVVVILFGLVALPASAHGGGLDRYGCHKDRKAGAYHCHRGVLAGRTFASQQAMLRETGLR